MSQQNGGKFSRREFARRAALGSAAALVPVTSSLPSSNERLGAALKHAREQEPQELPAGGEKLSAQSRAECEARYQAILAQYGGRFSEAQKVDLRRLCFAAQPGLDTLRAFKVENGDGVALYLKPLVEREKKDRS